MRKSWLFVVASTLALGACGVSDPSTSAKDDPEASNPYYCADLFAPDLLPTFEIQIAPAEWSALQSEFADWMARQQQNLDLKPYHPLIQFKYGDEVVTDAQIKLQGNPTDHWTGSKMELKVSFNEVDSKHRFHGLRKLIFHASPNEFTFLRERVALAYMRGLGLAAPCANNSRLVVNGAYYGLYTNKEQQDDEYIKRVFPDGRGGDLWKSGYLIETHPTPLDPASHDALMNVQDSVTLQSLTDIDEVIADWAAEAMIPDNDGYWAVNHNYYLYQHPTRKFLWLPTDLDASFDFTEFSADPVTWVPFWSAGWGTAQQAGFADPALLQKFVAALETSWAAYDVSLLKSRLSRWQAQIDSSAREDPNKPFSVTDYQQAVSSLNNYFDLRRQFMRSWLDCWETGKGPDADGDGFIWCHDCNDHDANINPSAQEICGNDVDENCNGRKDDCGPAM
jgi:hypothetical protein